MVGSKCVRYESGPCGILYASRTNLYVCLLALSLSQVWAHGASFDFFISFSLSLILFFHPSSSISRIGLSVVSI